MLDPRDRCLLLESLRPPLGYKLDFAIATTFSLDLLALLTAPLAFTFFDWEDQEGRLVADPLALLEAARRHADRIAVFCQAGQIAVPKSIDQPLFTFLEDSVFEVRARADEHVFHPKVWLLRYEAPQEQPAYRLLSLSRNLTFDRSWDTALVLDGTLTKRKRGFGANRPLADFMASLPSLAIRTVPSETRARVKQIQNEIRKVKFEPPEGFDRLKFWPLGIEKHQRWPFTGRIDRMLVVSPFLASRALERLQSTDGEDVLVSRQEELSRMEPSGLRQFSEVFAMSAEAVGEEAEEDTTADEALTAPEAHIPDGLHAKIYVAEAGWDARVWVGSANATNAAFGGNVEFLVELTGKKSAVGIDAFLNEAKGDTTFLSLIEPFEPGDDMEVGDPEQEAADKLVDQVRAAIAKLGLSAAVGSPSKGGKFEVKLQRATKRVPKAMRPIEAACWPITVRRETRAVDLDLNQEPVAVFRKLSFEALTSFFAFEVKGRCGAKSATRRFVLNLPLTGAPEDRRQRVLRHLLKDRDHVLRFLLLLLSDEGLQAPHELTGVGTSESTFDQAITGFGSTLLEALVRALDRDPARLDQVAHLVKDLQESPDSAALLPEKFLEIWRPVWTVRQQLSQ